MSGEKLGRIPGCWQEAEAEENAADLCDYLRRVLWRNGSPPELVDALDRFEAATKGTDYRCIEASEIQYFRRWLVRLELCGIVRRGLPDYELALDRLNAIECSSFGPLHRGWLFDAGELEELKRMAAAFDSQPKFDFVSAIGFACSCNRPTAFLVVHDGTPTAIELTRPCLRTFRHGCETTRSLDSMTVGQCHTAPGGIDAVITRARSQIESRGVGVVGPYLFKRGDLFSWPVKSEAVS